MFKTKTLELQFKDIDFQSGIVKGYFTSFGNKDSDGDIAVKGMFSKTISERGPQSSRSRIKWLLDHDTTKAIGVLTVLKEDDFGLYYEGEAGKHFQGQDFLKMAESGIITEHSYGYQTLKEKAEYDGNHLLEVKMWEGSCLQTWGANENTPLQKALTKSKDQIQKRIKALDSFCRNTTATDDTIELLLIEIKQLGQLLIDRNQPTENVIDPPKDNPELLGSITKFNNLSK